LEKQFKDVSKASAQASQKADVGSAKGIKTVNEELEKQKKVQNELSKINKQKQAVDERLRQAESARGKSIERTNQRLLRQRQANRTLAKETDNLNSAYGRASAKLTRLTKEYKDLEFQNKGNTREAKRLLRQITALDTRLKATDKTVGQSQRNVGNYSSAFRGVLGPLVGVTAAVAGFTAAVSASIKLFTEFGLATAKVQAISGATAEEFEGLKKQAQDLGAVTPFTASNVAQLQLELSKLGFTANQITDSTEAILNFAIATDSELGRSAEVVASTLNAFNLEASEAGKVADIAAKAFSSSALDIEKFATAISNVGPAANAVDVSLERTTAILGKIVDSGVDASTAGTQLRNVFIELEKEGLTWNEAIEQINGSQNSLSAANELFGKRGAVVATVIANNSDEIDKLDESLQNSAGSAEAAAAIIGDTLDGDLKRLTSSLQALVLGNSDFAKSLRGLIQGLTRFINFIGGVEKAQDNLIDSNLALLRSSQDTAENARALSDAYVRLTEKEKLTKEETDELNGVKTQLLNTFDESIAKINDETGAIEINIEALEQKIATEIALQSEAARALVADKLRLKTQIALAGNIGLVAKNQLEQNQSLSINQILFLKSIKTAEDYNQAISDLSDTQGLSNDAAAKQIELQRSLEKIFGRSGAAAFSLGNNELELKKIEDELLDLGLDLNAIAEKRIEVQDRLGAAITRTGDAEKDTRLQDAEAQNALNFEITRLALIEESAKKIKAAKDREFATDASRQAEVLRLQEELASDLNDAEIDRIQDLINVRGDIIETDDLKQIQLKTQLQEKLTDLTIEGLEERSDAQIKADEKSEKARIKAEKDRLDAIAKLQKDIQDGTVAALDVLDQAFAKASQNRLDEIDRETAALKTREDQLRQAAQNGSELAKDNLATNQRLQAEQERIRDEQVKKAQRREIVLAGLKAFAENAGQPGAVQKTLTDITTLSAALLNILPGFYDGTEDTGKAGQSLDSNGGRLAVLHDNERVMTKDQNKLLGGLSNDEVSHIVHDHINPSHFDNAPIVQVQRFESNEALLQRVDKLVEKVDQLPDRMPRVLEESFDERSKVYKTVIKTGNKVEKNHKRIGGIWGQ
jgi:hypothetical protein